MFVIIIDGKNYETAVQSRDHKQTVRLTKLYTDTNTSDGVANS